jgi:hypothetical protein
LPATLYWTFVPVCQIASLAVVARRRKMPFAHLIDSYFKSHTAWLLWVMAFAAIWAFVPAPTVYGWMFLKSFWFASAALVFAWSAYVDFGFFRQVLGRPPGQAARELAIQRLLCWAVALAIFVAPAGWQVVASAIGL